MNNDLLIEIMVFTLPFIVVFAYFSSVKQSTKEFGSDYMEVVKSYQWKCLKGIGLISIYLGLSFYQGGWEKILTGVAFSASAFTFFVLAIHEMACGICVSHKMNVPKKGIVIISRLIIIGLVLSLISTILVFLSTSVHWVLSGFQIILFLLAVLAYYIAGTTINLIRIGHVPTSHNKSSNADGDKAAAGS